MTIPQTLYWEDSSKRPGKFGRIRSEQHGRCALHNSFATIDAFSAGLAARRTLANRRRDAKKLLLLPSTQIEGLLPERTKV